MAWIKNEPIPPVRRAEVEPPAIFRKLYRPIGEIALTFADLEAQVTRTLNLLLETSWREGAALEWFMQNFSQRIELLYFLAIRPIERFPTTDLTTAQQRRQSAHAELRKSAEAIYSALQQANADRNNLLHGAWTGLSPTDGTYSKDRLQAARGRLKEIPMRGISALLLKEEADFIISVHMRLTDWTARRRRWDRPDLWPAPLLSKYLVQSPLARLLEANRKQDAGKQQGPRRQRAPSRR